MHLEPTYDAQGKLVSIDVCRSAGSDDTEIPTVAEQAAALNEQRAEGQGLPSEHDYSVTDHAIALSNGVDLPGGLQPANGDTWPQFFRRESVIRAALKGGATDAEAKELAQWDHDNHPSPDKLRERFAYVIGKRVITPRAHSRMRHDVAKRYRAKARW